MSTDEKTGKIRQLELRLSDMVLASVEEMQVLTLHPDYFRLTRPIERRLYEIARKAVGQDRRWSFKMQTLHQRSGSKGSLREFRRQLKPVIETNHLPDYRMTYDAEADMVTFINRNTMPRDTEIAVDRARSITQCLSPACFADARAIAEGWDVYYLADRFGAWWVSTGKPLPRNADAVFRKFCATWLKKNGRPI